MKNNYIIIGSGFRGFCDAVELLKNPLNKVHIIDTAPFFGGISYSRDVKGFAVDKGVHMFDSIPVELADIITEIMDGQVRNVDFVSSSAFNGKISHGFSLPDLSSLEEDIKSKIARELIALAASYSSQKEPKNLSELFDLRYGKTVGQIFSKIFQNIYNITADQVQPDAISRTSFGRLKFLDDSEMLVLKAHPWLENVLAARRKSQKKFNDYVSIYPDSGDAMRGWCDRSVTWLKNKGVQISLGEKIISIKNIENGVCVYTDKQTIYADQIIWANDNVNALANALDIKFDISEYVHGTPMIFATMITKAKDIKNFTYLQNFNPDGITFRSSAAGIFSNQVTDEGYSFITCECPVKIGSDKWLNADNLYDEIWNECKDLGVVENSALLTDYDIVRLPSTFKLAKIGFNEKVNELTDQISKKSERVLLRNLRPFFRQEIYLDSVSALNSEIHTNLRKSA